MHKRFHVGLPATHLEAKIVPTVVLRVVADVVRGGRRRLRMRARTTKRS
jgi:hypothetical protein